jgi:hypothetical protein
MGKWSRDQERPLELQGTEGVAGRLALWRRGFERIAQQPISISTVLCLHPLASTRIHSHPPHPEGLEGAEKYRRRRSLGLLLLEAGAMLNLKRHLRHGCTWSVRSEAYRGSSIFTVDETMICGACMPHMPPIC